MSTQDPDARIRELEQRLRESDDLTRRTTLEEYLTELHQIETNPAFVKVIKNSKGSTTGPLTEAVGRYLPKSLVPGNGFEELTGLARKLHNGHVTGLPSKAALELLKEPQKVDSETSLTISQANFVEMPIQCILEALAGDIKLVESLGCPKEVQITDHQNSLELSGYTTSSKKRKRALTDGRKAPVTPSRKPRAGPPDRYYFCDDGIDMRPVMLVEYKPSHKLLLEHLILGLEKPIDPKKDIIDVDDDTTVAGGDDEEFKRQQARTIVTAAVTQLYTAMCTRRVRDGLLVTSDAKVHIRIDAEDPGKVTQNLFIPSRDYDAALDNENDLAVWRTGTAIVLLILLQATSSAKPGLNWHGKVEELQLWPDQRNDILLKIPSTEKKTDPSPSTYSASSGSEVVTVKRLPYKLRKPLACRPSNDTLPVLSGNGDDPDTGSKDHPDIQSSSPSRSALQTRQARAASNTDNTKKDHSRRDNQRQNHSSNAGRVSDKCHYIDNIHLWGDQISLREAQYCTHTCLLGVLNGGPIDVCCPNSRFHGAKHVSVEEFRTDVADQIENFRSESSDWWYGLWRPACNASVHKIRHMAGGYVFFAKAVREGLEEELEEEEGNFREFQSAQGHIIPVCLGLIRSQKPVYSELGRHHMLLAMSYTGYPANPEDLDFQDGVQMLRCETRRHGFAHNDFEPRNVTVDQSNRRYMLVDLHTATRISDLDVPQRPVLKSISTNKRKRGSDLEETSKRVKWGPDEVMTKKA